MTWKRRAAALLLGVLMLFTSAPVVMPVFAGGGESESAGTAVISDIHTSSVNYGDLTAGTTEDHVWEGRPARIEFSVTLDAEQDSPFAVGDIITVETNIGELFAPQNGWDKYTEQSIFDENGALLATVRIAEDGTKLVFTIAEGAAGQTKIENGYVELPALTAKEGMTAEGETAQETLTINGADGTITFHKTEARLRQRGQVLACRMWIPSGKTRGPSTIIPVRLFPSRLIPSGPSTCMGPRHTWKLMRSNLKKHMV